MKHTATLDTSFWVNVQRVGLLPYVQSRYLLCYAPDVAGEMNQTFSSGREFWRLARGGLLTQVPAEMDQVKDLGPGERAAINLALEHPDWILLLDDQKPYQEAVQRGLRVLCSPVLVAAMFSEGALDVSHAMLALARLAALQTVSPHLLAAAITHVGRSWKQPRGV
jgi:predicted nucleic acid-binding protein